MQHFLIGDGVDKAIRAEQQVFSGFHRADVAVALGVRIRSQSAGDKITVRMAASLLGSDVTTIHHTFHKRVILGNA